MMLNTFAITRAAEEYKQGIHALGKSLQASSWAKGQGLLISERTDVFRNDEEDEGEEAADYPGPPPQEVQVRGAVQQAYQGDQLKAIN